MYRIICLLVLCIGLNGYATKKNVKVVSENTSGLTAPYYVLLLDLTPNSVAINWTVSTFDDIVGSEIYQNGQFLASLEDKTFFRAENLTEGVTYEFSIRVFDAAGNYSEFTTISATPILDTEPPTAPTNLTASDIRDDFAYLSWTGANDNSGVGSANIYVDGVLLNSVLGYNISEYRMSNLEPNTTYNIRITVTDISRAGNESGFSNSITITTKATYCIPPNYNTDYEYIDYVGIEGISNTTTTSNGGYGDYTSMFTDISYGLNTIELSAGFVNETYPEGFGVWIDFNQNDLYEVSEHVVSAAVQDGEKYSYTFIVPSNAKLGNTKMRVVLKYNGVPVACEMNNEYGEVEDYSVRISFPLAKSASSRRAIVNEIEKESSIKIYPNPADQYIRIDIPNKAMTNYTINDVSGRIIRSGIIQDSKVKLENLESGTYFISILNGKEKLTKRFVKK